MLKRNSKSFFGLILVIALVFSMFPTMPSSVAYAAATNLLPSTLTLNGNIKASSQQSTRTAVNIGNSVTWTLGANTVYSANGSNLWVAIDLGSQSNIEGFNFHTTATDVNTINRSSQYELSYSNDSSLWNKLSTNPNNNAINFSPTANGWSSAAIVPTNIATGTVTNGTYSWSLDANTGYYTSDLTFTAPITARYILINYTLKPSATGQLGIGLLKIIPPVTLSSSSGSFYKTLQNAISTQVNLDAATSFTGITNGSYTLVEGTDYTIDANNVVTFSNTYLSSLNGSYNLRFNFSSSQGSSFLPYVLTVAAAADSSLSPQGTAYIPMLPSTISTTMNLNGNHFTSISEGTTILPSSAYAVSGNTVTFNQSFLDTLSMGTHSFIFNFDQGNPQTFMLTISGKPPVAGIDYRYWTLQEPLPGGAGQTSQTLQAGYADPYFYVGADGSQVFMDTAVGGTTSGSAHPRSELREYDPIAGTDAAWLPVGTNAMTGTVAVTKLGTLNGVGWTTIGQVFDQNVTTLCEFEYGYDPAYPNSNIRILYEPSGINSLGYQYLPIKIPLNQYFTYRMTLNDGVLSIYLNGSLIFNGQTASPSQVIPPNHLYYFKAGNYDQTAMNGNVNYIPYTIVQFNSLSLYHASTVDNAPPVTSDNAPANWVNNDVTVTLAATDNDSGVDATYYKVDGGAQQTGTSVTISAEGTHTLTYWSVDKAGNIEAAHTATVQIDKTVPVTTDSAPAYWVNNDVTVTLTATDSGSGVDATYYTVDGGPQQTGTTVNIAAEGTHTLTYWSVDKAGNIEVTHTATVQIDKTAPAITGAPTSSPNANGWYNSDVTVHFNCSDAGSGVASCTQDTKLSTEGANQSVQGTAIDNAGNSATAQVNGINIDKTSPLTTDNAPANRVNNDVTVTLTATDGGSGVDATYYTVDGGAQQTGTTVPISAEGTHTLTYWSVDKAGNIEAAHTATVQIDKTVPVVAVTVHFDCSDTGSGAASCIQDTKLSTEGAAEYTVDVANSVSSISITPTAADTGVVIRVNGTTSVSGATYGPLNLAVGANKIEIEVTPQSGAAKTYTITVNRANVVLPTSADLSNLVVSAGSLAPVFNADTTGYTVNVANSVSSISVTPSAADAEAVIRVNGTTSVSGATYGPLNLAVGANKIEIEVTPQSGAAKTYTIMVNRENVVLPTSADLSNLAVSAGSLAPVFNADTTGYTVNVANSVSSISVTPSAADAGAVIRVNGATSVSGATYGPLNLAVGTNKIEIEVTPQSGASKTYTIMVNRENAPDTSGPSSSVNRSDSSTINEKQTAESYIDDKTIDNILKSSTNGKLKLSVDSSVNADQNRIIFTNSAMQKLITQKSAVSLNLGTQLGSYELPLKEINLQNLAAKLGVAKDKVNVEVIVSKDNAAVEKAKSSGKTVLGAVEFTLRAASSEGKSIEISNFTTYVARTIKAETPLNARNLAAVRVETDKQGNTVYQPVPFTVSGTEATIYSRTNSTYMLIENKVTFADLNNHWAKNDIERMANKMIVQGVSENQFLPEQAITRAEFAALIARTLGLKPGGTSKNLFIDVHQGDWFEDQVYAVAGAGIVAGYEDHSFHPNALITRQEMAVMIQRAMNFAGYDHSSTAGNKVKFTDEHLFDQWAQAPIAEIAGMKIIEGADSGKFDPAAAATRAQSTVILSRMLAVLQFTK